MRFRGQMRNSPAQVSKCEVAKINDTSKRSLVVRNGFWALIKSSGLLINKRHDKWTAINNVELGASLASQLVSGSVCLPAIKTVYVFPFYSVCLSRM